MSQCHTGRPESYLETMCSKREYTVRQAHARIPSAELAAGWQRLGKYRTDPGGSVHRHNAIARTCTRTSPAGELTPGGGRCGQRGRGTTIECDVTSGTAIDAVARNGACACA